MNMTVEDSGIGIQEQKQADILNMLKSLKSEPKFNDTTRTVGLGLCISKMIVGKFNGTISFFTEFKKGSSFYFNFDLEEFEQLANFKQDSLEQIDSKSNTNLHQGQNMVSFIDLENQSLLQKQIQADEQPIDIELNDE